jgi:hypothetical protein
VNWGALGHGRALDAAADTSSAASTGFGVGASSPRGADGALPFPWDPPPIVDLTGDDGDEE